MSRVSWGGSNSNLSDLFTSLINADQSRVQQGVQSGVAQAQKDKQAEDADMQAKWKAGKITNQQWVDFLKSRADTATDPAEKQAYEQAYLENKDAVVDAEWETRFLENKITVSQLMQHYRQRMNGVEAASPAYRDLANRFSQLSQFQASGGVYYRDSTSGGGGGSGGGSSSSSGVGKSNTIKGANDILQGLAGGKTNLGLQATYDQGGIQYDTSGTPGVVQTLFAPPETLKSGALAKNAISNTVIDGVDGSLAMLDAINAYMQDNPDATSYTDESGNIFSITPELKRAIDNQYLNLLQVKANTQASRGDNSAASKTKADALHYVSTTMRDHNTENAQPVVDQFMATMKSSLQDASKIADPTARQSAYAQIGAAMDAFAQRVLPTTAAAGTVKSRMQEGADSNTKGMQNVDITKYLPLEQLVSADEYKQWSAVREAIDIGAKPWSYTDQQVSDAFDNAQTVKPLGTGAAAIDPSELYGDDSVGHKTLGTAFVGVGVSRAQAIGLNWADRIQKGLASPQDAVDGNGQPLPLYTYSYDPATQSVVVAPGAVQNMNGHPEVVPAGMDQSNSTQFVTTVGGKATPIWVPTNNNDTSHFYVYRFGQTTVEKMNGKDVTFHAGDLVPSSVIAGWGNGVLSRRVATGQAVKTGLPGVTTIDVGGQTWYHDSRTNEWSAVPPWSLISDPTDRAGAVQVSDPGVDSKGNADWSSNDDYHMTGMILKAGLPGYAVPYGGISSRGMQEWVDGQVANGNIQPSDYMHVAADGYTPTQTDVAKMYWDTSLSQVPDSTDTPVLNANARFQADQAAAKQRADQQIAIRNQVKDTVMAGQAGLWRARTPDQQDVPTSVVEAAKSFGINVDVNTPEPVRGFTPLADTGVPIHNALQAVANRKQLAAQPKFEPKITPPDQSVRPSILMTDGQATPPVAPIVKPPALPLIAPETAAAIKAGQKKTGKGLTAG